MTFHKSINLFELTEKITARFRTESGLSLSGYEFEFKFKRDWNCPLPRIYFNFFIFGEEYAHTVFDEKQDTVDKVLDLLLVHLRDDAGMEDLKEGLLMAKRHRLETRTERLTERIEELSKQLLESQGMEALVVFVDEAYPRAYYDNGFPKLQYQIYLPQTALALYIDLDFNLRGFREEDVFTAAQEAVKQYLGKHEND